MATIRITNDDLRKMIQEAVSRLYEGSWYQSEPLCRLPYFVSANFSDHAIDREDEREIHEEDIIENLKLAVQDIINDYNKRKLNGDSYVKVIDRDKCIVAVCGINPSYNKKRIHQIVVVTTYIWDGKINIDKGYNYYVNEPSEEYLEAKEWNEENQDKVIPYMEWKRDSDINKQRKKAETEYYWRNHPHEPSAEKRMNRINQTFDRYERRQKYDVHDSLPDGDLKAIRDYFRDMDKKKIKLEPYELKEMIQRVTKRVLSEALAVDNNVRDIWDMANRIYEAVYNFDDEQDQWEFEDDYHKEGAAYRDMGPLCGVDSVCVIVDYDADENFEAAYDNENNQIWVLFKDGLKSRNNIFTSLIHELIHNKDQEIGKAYNQRFNPRTMNDELWEPIRKVFYMLWSNTEFNAHQSVVALGDMSRSLWEAKYIEKRLMECSEVMPDDEQWDLVAKELADAYENQSFLKWPREKVRDFFLQNSWKKFENFKRKLVRKTSHYEDGQYATSQAVQESLNKNTEHRSSKK